MLRPVSVTLLVAALNAQVQTPTDLKRVTHDLRDAIRDDDGTAAADLAAKLDDGVQRQYRAWLIRDARERVDEVLTLLPGDTESLMVHQYPFTITEDAPEMLAEGRPSQICSTDRLVRLNEGSLYKALRGRTIRLVVAGVANMRSRGRPGVYIDPPLAPDADAVWFYFFTEPIRPESLGVPEQSTHDRPVWRGTAKISSGQRALREDETWLALARPDLLVMASTHELLVKIVTRLVNGSNDRALPATLPEWAHVNRAALFWGIRHYSDPGTGNDPTNPRTKNGTLPMPDPAAVGMAVQFDPESHQVELEYLTGAVRLPRIIDEHSAPQFLAEQPQAGLWRLTSDSKQRGPNPFRQAAGLLGFGGYR
jgi:hypothetical protein